MSLHAQDGDIGRHHSSDQVCPLQAFGFSDGFQREAPAIPKGLVPILTSQNSVHIKGMDLFAPIEN